MVDAQASLAREVADLVRPHLPSLLHPGGPGAPADSARETSGPVPIAPGEPAHGAPDLDTLADALGRFAATLAAANTRINLTGITDAVGMARLHVLDSLLAWELLDGDGPLLDLGSGCGVPGIPLALALPSRPVVLVESRERKAAALGTIVDALGLAPRVQAVRARAESWLAEHAVDTVLVRAVGDVATVLRLLTPVRGAFRRLILLKGPAVDKELAAASAALDRWGRPPSRHDRTLPGGDEQRTLLVFAGDA